ncbi:small ribosomal subunit protein uS12m-like isoform X2 [Apteryx mantelli]|uniref:Small ribosomal subunit protein uS12m n=1 Tax=Apteryx mantelli TaxID=2696672 RepID=A0ABM4G0D1_9AVES
MPSSPPSRPGPSPWSSGTTSSTGRSRTSSAATAPASATSTSATGARTRSSGPATTALVSPTRPWWCGSARRRTGGLAAAPRPPRCPPLPTSPSAAASFRSRPRRLPVLSACKMAGSALLRTVASLRGWGLSALLPRGPAPLGRPEPPNPQPGRAMATLNQMHRQGRPKPPPPKLGATFGRPQLKGVVIKNLIRKPKKPNSANRKCVRVRLSNGKEVICFVPGEGHNLQEHHIVLVQGGRTQDLPGVKLTIVRGKYDCAHVQKKK